MSTHIILPPESGSDIAVRSPVLSGLRVAIVHDYLNQEGGAERVVEVLCRMFPGAPLFTSVYDSDAMDPFWKSVDVRTTYLQRFTTRLGVAKALLPLYPRAFESLDLSGFDVIISSSSSFAKGVISPSTAVHVCYCYTPTRFLWMYDKYVQRQSLPFGARAILPPIISRLRKWDYLAAQRPDRILGISNAVSGRIAAFYDRQAEVVYPPVDVRRYEASLIVDDYFLVVARLGSYKRIDIAVDACTALDFPLKIVGDGPDRRKLESLAGRSVQFLGRLPGEEVRSLLARCRALIWPGEEDFGLVPVEAQAAGRPVIAYSAGGAVETVVDGLTGMLFSPQTSDALARTLRNFDPLRFSADDMRHNAKRFDLSVFVQRMTTELESAVRASTRGA